MKALVYHGKQDIRYDQVPDPAIEDSKDIILKVTSTAICGSDLHLYNGLIPQTKAGDVFGHEFMGEVVEKGSSVENLQIGDKVVVPFPIACGRCLFCEDGLFSLCDNSNPNYETAELLYGYSPAGIFGYSHIFGGYRGGQAEYVRVPYADVGPFKINSDLPDDKILFLSDIFPTGYMAAENCDIRPGQTVAIWGCGPVGLFAVQSAFLLGAGRVISIDRFPERLALARRFGAETINYEEVDNVIEVLKDMTAGLGPESCIDAVGMEAHGTGIANFYDKLKQSVRAESDRPTALREVVQACRKGGTISIGGVYGGLIDKFPIGAAFNKGLTFKMGQTHVHRYMEPLFGLIEEGLIDPSAIITHRLNLEQGPKGYEIFKDKEDNCIKVVMSP